VSFFYFHLKFAPAAVRTSMFFVFIFVCVLVARSVTEDEDDVDTEPHMYQRERALSFDLLRDGKESPGSKSAPHMPEVMKSMSMAGFKLAKGKPISGPTGLKHTGLAFPSFPSQIISLSRGLWPFSSFAIRSPGCVKRACDSASV